MEGELLQVFTVHACILDERLSLVIVIVWNLAVVTAASSQWTVIGLYRPV